MTELTKTNRRGFLRRTATGAGALWVSSLQEFSVKQAVWRDDWRASPYGSPSPKIDGTTGLKLIQLPDGFRYWSYGWTGDIMSDGVKSPALHDGMAVIDEWHDDDDDDDRDDTAIIRTTGTAETMTTMDETTTARSAPAS